MITFMIKAQTYELRGFLTHIAANLTEKSVFQSFDSR